MSHDQAGDMESLSRYLKNMVRDMDRDYLEIVPPEEQAEIKEAARFWRKYITDFLRAIEGFCDSPPPKRIPRIGGINLLEDWLDDKYVHQLLERIPKMVRRTLKLSEIFTRIMPSQATDLYLREATRTYIYGFWQASIALSRSAVEQGLRERLTANFTAKAGDLAVMIERGYIDGLLDQSRKEWADEVRLTANAVLHQGKRVTEMEAYDTLCQARGILVHLFLEG